MRGLPSPWESVRGAGRRNGSWADSSPESVPPAGHCPWDNPQLFSHPVRVCCSLLLGPHREWLHQVLRLSWRSGLTLDSFCSESSSPFPQILPPCCPSHPRSRLSAGPNQQPLAPSPALPCPAPPLPIQRGDLLNTQSWLRHKFKMVVFNPAKYCLFKQ